MTLTINTPAAATVHFGQASMPDTLFKAIRLDYVFANIASEFELVMWYHRETGARANYEKRTELTDFWRSNGFQNHPEWRAVPSRIVREYMTIFLSKEAAYAFSAANPDIDMVIEPVALVDASADLIKEAVANTKAA